jgi:hypothetical protein
MSDEINIDLDQLIYKKMVRGVADVSLELENKKLGDDEITRLANMEILAEVARLDLGENNISYVGVSALCLSPYTNKLKSHNLKSN